MTVAQRAINRRYARYIVTFSGRRMLVDLARKFLYLLPMTITESGIEKAEVALGFLWIAGLVSTIGQHVIVAGGDSE